MAVTPFESAHFRDLFHDTEIGKLFTDSAEMRAMLLVEGALGKVQGEMGVIPETCGLAIHRASMEIQIDPGALAAETGQSAVVVPALVKLFRAEMKAPDYAQYIHWGATSQDIMDTGLVLRLRQVLSIYEQRLRALIATLGQLAETHADLPMAGRTYGQLATPTSFGAVLASWGMPLIRHLDRLDALRGRLLNVSLSGAAGTLSAMGDQGPQVRANLAAALGLSDPGGSWHSTRDTIAELSGWITMTAASLGKMGEDITLMTMSGINEVSLAQGGGSSTMPQKSNPVLPTLLVALANHANAMNTALQGAAIHRQQRDGAAWFTEWLTLPQLCMSLGQSLAKAQPLAEGLKPDPDAMARGFDDGLGLIYAEALSFALTQSMARPAAQQAVKDLCKKVQSTGTPLADLARAEWPDIDFAPVFSVQTQLGTAPAEARAFAVAAKSL